VAFFTTINFQGPRACSAPRRSHHGSRDMPYRTVGSQRDMNARQMRRQRGWSAVSLSGAPLTAPSFAVRRPPRQPPPQDPRSPIATAQGQGARTCDRTSPTEVAVTNGGADRSAPLRAGIRRRIAPARQLRHQLAQGIEIVGRSIDRHEVVESDSRSVVTPSNPT
jgi:hypothetical protein